MVGTRVAQPLTARESVARAEAGRAGRLPRSAAVWAVGAIQTLGRPGLKFQPLAVFGMCMAHCKQIERSCIQTLVYYSMMLFKDVQRSAFKVRLSLVRTTRVIEEALDA